MIKRYVPDIFIAALILALAFFIAAGPPSPVPDMHSRPQKQALAQVSGQKQIWVPPVPTDTALAKRNLFEEDGYYVRPVPKKPKIVLPENPYSLVAILMGKDKKAVIRNYTGAIQTLPAGATLIDDGVITEITPVSVKIRNGEKTKEMKLFDVKLKTAESTRPGIEKSGQARR